MASQTLYRRPRAGATLLSLDGGGVKGISSLLILKLVMDKVREIEGRDLKTERLPKDYFDLAGGTSTGALAALMLFRLNMPTSTVIDHYGKLAATVFAPTIGGIEIHKYPLGYSFGNFWLWVKRLTIGSGFSADRLEKAIDKVTRALPEKGATKLRDDSGQYGRMLMCATVADKGETVLFRSYKLPGDSRPQSETAKAINHDNITIKQACRGTSAAPTYLPEMKIPSRNGTPIRFWDGGLLNNNPVDQVWDARYDLPAARVTNNTGEVTHVEPVVSCVVSIGTSYYPSPPNPARNLLNVLLRTLDFATNTQAKHWDFMGNDIRRNARLNPEERTKYFRYNAKASRDINLDDYQQMGRLERDTEVYLRNFDNNLNAEGVAMSEDELENHILRCAQELAKTEEVLDHGA